MKIQLELWEERNINNFLNAHHHWFEGMDDIEQDKAIAHFFRQIKEYLALEHIIDNLHNFGYSCSYHEVITTEYLYHFLQIFGGTSNIDDEEKETVDFYYGRIQCTAYVELDEHNDHYYIKLSPKFDMAWYNTDEWVTLNINEILCSY